MPAAVVGVVGAIVAFAGPQDEVPENWIPCDGRELPRREYPDLARIIGRMWSGPPPPATHPDYFRIPNLGGRVIVGAGQGDGLTGRLPGATGGKESHDVTATVSEAQAQSFWASTAASGSTPANYAHTVAHRHSVSAPSIDLLPPYLVLTYIVCAK